MLNFFIAVVAFFILLVYQFHTEEAPLHIVDHMEDNPFPTALQKLVHACLNCGVDIHTHKTQVIAIRPISAKTTASSTKAI